MTMPAGCTTVAPEEDARSSSSLENGATTATAAMPSSDPASLEENFDADLAIAQVNRWLHLEGRDCDAGVSEWLKAYVPLCQSLHVPLDRVYVGSRVVHPQVAAFRWTYCRPRRGRHRPQENAAGGGGDVVEGPSKIRKDHGVRAYCGGKEGGDDHNDDSWYHEDCLERTRFAEMYRTLHPDEPLVKLRRDGPESTVRYQTSNGPETWPTGTVADLFEEEGFTDLYGRPVFYQKNFLLGITWSTRRPDGFTSEHIRFFDATMPMIAATLHLLVQQLISYSLLRAYLGSDPGRRVFRGSVTRGSGLTAKGVVWFSDVRNFTHYSSHHPRDDVLALVNRVFEATNDCIVRHGGEVLKFMGDGTLGLFTHCTLRSIEEQKDCNDSATAAAAANFANPSAASAAELCRRAGLAALELQQVALPALNRERVAAGLDPVRIGIGLHYGDCSYGNVGAHNRLDFTVIGPAVNLAARVEGLCSSLGARILATGAVRFWDDVDESDSDEEGKASDIYIEGDRWRHRGQHPVKGVPEPVEVYELVVVDDNNVSADVDAFAHSEVSESSY